MLLLVDYTSIGQPINSISLKKIHLSPSPISIESQPKEIESFHYPLKIFIGISKHRHEYKGTDIMLQAAKTIATKYPSKVILHESKWCSI